MFRWSLAFVLALPFAAQAQITATIDSKIDLENAPVRVPLQWPKTWKAPGVVTIEFGGTKNAVGQLTEPNFTTDKIKADDGKIRKDLVLIASKLKAGEPIKISIPEPTTPVDTKLETFAWKDTPNDHTDLVFTTDNGAKSAPVLRYMYKTYDPSSPATRNKTYKVFHHVFDPSGSGKIITNGGHTNEDLASEKDLVFPHHRGLMFGINKCSYGEKGEKKADTWHCTGDAHVSHVKTLFETAGPNVAEQRVLLTWHGPKNEVFAEEERQMTVYKVPGGNLIEFATRLTPKVGKVKLDGDPQHAGFQFRAHNDVAKKTAGQTYYLRPDGKGEKGKTRNWPGEKDKTTNLPWNVVSFVLGDKRYSVEYIDHPNNPGEKRYSERDYGRFGCYFEYDLTPENPLVLNHRIWVQEGDMTAEQASKLRDAFVTPPTIATK